MPMADYGYLQHRARHSRNGSVVSSRVSRMVDNSSSAVATLAEQQTGWFAAPAVFPDDDNSATVAP